MLQKFPSNAPIAASGHNNALSAVRDSIRYGKENREISERAANVPINNMVYAVNGQGVDVQPQPLNGHNEAYRALLLKVLDNSIGLITIYSPDKPLFDDHYYSTRRAEAAERRTAGLDDVIYITRDSDYNMIISWGNADKKVLSGTGIQVPNKVISEYLKNEDLHFSLAFFLEKAFTSAVRAGYIDISLHQAFTGAQTSVKVIGHAIYSGKYNAIVAKTDCPSMAVQEKAATQIKQSNKGDSTMKTTISAVIAENKAAAVNAGEMEAGRLVVDRIVKVVKPRLPVLTRGYVDSDLGRVVVANLFAALVREYMPNNGLAGRAADGAVKSAAYEALRGIDIPAMLDEVLKGFTDKTATEEASAPIAI